VPTDPTIPITAATVAAYQSGRANQESEVPVAAGELLTELSALEGLLVDWGTDMATLLAEWDAGSVSAYDAKMKATAVSLGLTSTHIRGMVSARCHDQGSARVFADAWLGVGGSWLSLH
jgi:D-alanyl-D-alanine carboxypeptidase